MDDYLSITTEIFTGMRLTIEGAVSLYEGDGASAYGILSKQDKEAARAYSTIGKALYDLRQSVIELEIAAGAESIRQA